jgi:glycolate oxidase
MPSTTGHPRPDPRETGDVGDVGDHPSWWNGPVHPTHAALIDALGARLPHEALVTEPDVMATYSADRAATLRPGRPVALVRAREAHHVAAAIRVAAEHAVPVVPRGLGTGLSGGSTAIDGCIVVSTEGLRDLSIDPAAMLATVGPGVRNAELKAAAAEAGLWYPPDPSSFEICSIGGNLATNAGGLCCVRDGVTTDYVLGLEVCLADGRLVHLGGRTIKDVAGYDLKRLFVGSEGTLGIITEAILRLRPAPPPIATTVATFPTLVGAGRAVASIVSRLRPAALELMDRAAVAAVEQVQPMDLDLDAAALLLARSDVGGSDHQRIAEACGDAGATYVATTEDPDEGEMLMAARRMAIPCVEHLGRVMIEDVSVPIPRIPDLLAAVEEVAARHRTRIPVIGHAGDGNFHPLVTFDPDDDPGAERAASAFREIMVVAIELGGTITGEHGVGLLKADLLAMQLGDDVMELTRRIKHALDPQGILNPGKWV